MDSELADEADVRNPPKIPDPGRRQLLLAMMLLFTPHCEAVVLTRLLEHVHEVRTQRQPLFDRELGDGDQSPQSGFTS